MYFFKSLKQNILDKKNILFTISSLLLYIFSYLSLKIKYFYEIINYIPTYINYYIKTYLNSDINLLISNNKIWFFVENDVQNIFSSIYLYFATQQNIFYTLIMIFTPILIFNFINSRFFDEFHSNFYKHITFRFGKCKYIISKITSYSITGGLLAIVPKLIYFLILSVFFTNGYSLTHYINNASFVQEQFLFFQNGFNPAQLLILDFVITFLYGVIISLLSMIITLISERKLLSYLIFFFIIIAQCILSIAILSHFRLYIMSPIIYMYSLVYFLFSIPKVMSLSYIILQYGIIIAILLIVLLITFNKKVEN